MADAAKNYTGFDDAHSVGMVWLDARGVANDAIDIFDPAAADTLGVMMVVGDARLVTSAGRVRQTDASDQSVT